MDQRTLLEKQLITSAKRGELPAFNQLVEWHQDAVYQAAYRITGAPDAADDAAQDAFIAAWKHIKDFRGGSFRAWLMRIVTNAVYDQLRARKRRPADSLEDMLHSGAEREPPEFVNGREGPEAHAERAELNRLLQAGIAALPDDQRIALVLADVQGLSYEEIAAATNANLGTVKSRINRARLRLRDWLTERQEHLPMRFRRSSERL